MKNKSLSHPHADGRLDLVLGHQIFLELGFKTLKIYRKKQTKNGFTQVIWHNARLQKPRELKMLRKEVIYTLFF